ncbi:phospholipase B1, membrane-associated-like [Clavelina lepadiformis]|uniref:phospholipase B1, membrane-associated-like n=1 Tax=Clavelina lepadiformis TaxID=159417 RepID=UPI0040437990
MKIIFHILAISAIQSKAAEDFDSSEWLSKLDKLQDIINSHHIAEQTPKNGRSTGSNDFGINLQCSPKPTTVHQLRPQDIDVVGAMGDSLTAANGADAATAVGILTEYRGLSWTIGGEETLATSITLPNILRKFNPKVKGYSVGSSYMDRDLWFNAAVAGARARDMSNQATDLVRRMKTDNRTNYENDWKLVTIFIGGNDLCALERDPNGASPETYFNELKKGLDILHRELPRTLVNVVDILEIYLLPLVSDGFGSTNVCRLLQRTFCGYIVTANAAEMENIREINKRYQTLVEDYILSGAYDTRDDFTVVLQPFLRDTVLPYTEDGQVDATYFAPDCFHFSTKGHAMGAINLWNNMLEPVGNKTTKWSITDLKCPTTEAPYIYTNVNSGIYGLEGSGTTPESEVSTVVTTPVKTTTKNNEIQNTTPLCQLECNEPVEDWVVAVICILAAAVLLEGLVMICCFRKKSKIEHSVMGDSDEHLEKKL